MLKSKLKEAITPENRQSRLRAWGVVAALFYGFGLAVFHAKADFEIAAWVNAYFLWQFAKDALFMAAICTISRFMWKTFSPLLFYSIIRLCLEAITTIEGTEANNPLIVTTLFIASITACIYSSIMYSREKWKEN